MTQTEILATLMERIDRLTTAVERLADAVERQAAYKGQAAPPDHSADSTDADQDGRFSRKPTDVELTKIDTILLSMDAGGRNKAVIAKQLNAEGLCTPQGGKWTESAVRTRLARLKG